MSPDLAALPPTITVPEAAEILGCSKDALYAAIRNDDAPVKVLRIGRKIVVPTAPLLERLGVSTPETDGRGLDSTADSLGCVTAGASS